MTEIEAEANAHCDELHALLPADGGAWLLSLQLRKLQTCLDVLGDGAGARHAGAVLAAGRARRGRERARALVFDPRARAFAHRAPAT